MIYSGDDLMRASLIGERVKVCYVNNNGRCYGKFKLCGIDEDSLKLKSGLLDDPQPLSLDCVESIEREPFYSEETGMQDGSLLKTRVEDFRQLKEKVLQSKANALVLYKHFPKDLENLRAALEDFDVPELKSFFASNSVMSGDIKHIDISLVREQLEKVCPYLNPELEPFARSLVAVACCDIPEAQMAYLKYANKQPFTSDFIRMYATKLAVIAMQSFSRKNQKKHENSCAFVYWVDKLLAVAPEQILDDTPLWLNYLNWCVTFQHFNCMTEVLRKCADTSRAFDALAYVFAIHEQPMLADMALRYLQEQGSCLHTPGELMVHLIDDELSYCMRFIDRVDRLVSDGKLGNPEAAYIYDYVRIRQFAHVVNGCLVDYFVNEKDINQSIIHDMTLQLREYLDYEPVLVEITLNEYSVTSVELW